MPVAEDVVVIRPDFSRFSSELASGLANLPAAEIKLEADLKGLGSDLVERISDAASEAGAVFAEALVSAISAVSIPPLDIEADTSALAESLGDFAPDGIDVSVSAETEEATASIDALIASLSAEAATIQLDADGAAALVAIGDIIDNIPGVDLELHVDPSAIPAEIAEATASIEPIEIPVSADTATVEAEIEDVRQKVEGTPAKLPVTGTESTNTALGRTVALAQAAKGGVAGVADEVGKMAGASTAALGAIGLAVGGAVIAFSAAKDAAIVAREAAAVFGDSVGELESVSFDGFTGSLQAAGEALGVDDEELKKFATNVGRVLEGAGASASRFADQLGNIAPQLAAIAIEAGTSLDQVESLIETAIVKGGARAEIGFKKLNIPVELDGLDTAEERANAVFEAIETKGGASFENISTAGERSFDRFKAKLGNIAETVGGPLLDLASSFVDGMTPGLEITAAIVSKAAELADNPIVKHGIKLAFEVGNPVALVGGLVDRFKDAESSATGLSKAFSGLGGTIGEAFTDAGGIKDAVGLLGNMKDAIAEVSRSVISVEVTGQEQLDGLTTAINSIAERDLGNVKARFGIDLDTSALDSVDEKIAAVGQAIAASVAENFPDLGETFKEVFSQDGIQSLDEFIATAQQKAADFAQFGARIKELTAAGFGDLAGFLAQQGPVAAEALGQLFDGTGQVIEGKARQLSDGINTSLATTFQGLSDLASAGIEQLQSQLGGAGGAEIALKIGLDPSEIPADIAAVKSQFDANPILAKVKADLDPEVLSTLQGQLAGAAIEFDAKVKTDPAGAAANLQGEIQAALDSLPAGTFKTTADRDSAAQALTEVITSATQSAPPAEIQAKTGPVDTHSLDMVRTQEPIEIPVRFSIPQRGKFGPEDFGALQSEQTITTKVVVSGQEQLDGVKNAVEQLKDRTVKVNAETGQTVDNIRAVQTSLDGLRDKKVDVSTNASAAVSSVNSLSSAISALRDKSVTITVNKVGDASATGASKGGIFDAVRGGVFVNLAEGGFREGVITTDPRYRAQMEAYIRQLGFGSVLDAPGSASLPTAASLDLSGAIGGGNIDLYPQGRAAASSFARGVAAGVAESAGGLLSGGKVGPAEVGYDAGFEAASSIAEAIKEATPAVEAASAALASAVTTNVGGPTGPVATAFNSLAARAKAAGVTIYDTANEMAAKLGVKIGYDLTGVGRPGEFAYSATATDLAAALKIDPGGYQYRLPGGGVGRSISTTDADLARLILGTTESARQVGIGNPNNALRDAEIAAHNLGAAVRSGFRDGLGDGYGAGTSYAREAVSGVEDYWGIASPSKVAADIGRNVGDGFIQGLEDQIAYWAGADQSTILTTKARIQYEDGSVGQAGDTSIYQRRFDPGRGEVVDALTYWGDAAKEVAATAAVFGGHVDAAAVAWESFSLSGDAGSAALQQVIGSANDLSGTVVDVSVRLAELAMAAGQAEDYFNSNVRSAARSADIDLASVAAEFGGSIGDVIDAVELMNVATGEMSAAATTSTKALNFFADITNQDVGGVMSDLEERGQSATEALMDFERWVTAASGGQPIPNATGGYYPARAGGYLLRAGEAGYDEAVVTADPRYRSMQLDRLERLGLVAAPSTSNSLAASSPDSGGSRNEVRVEQTIVTPYADPGLVADEVTARLSRFIRGLS